MNRRLDTGGRVDRTRQLKFSFDGRSYVGLEGDTLASALLANGVSLVGRSFKYHRPRGILSAGSEEPNALVELRKGVRREPNTRATTIELYDGLEANSQNRWPSLRFDFLSLTRPFSKLMGAGFYYKTFMWPASFWEKIYEPLIRRAAGLGRAADGADPDHYEKAFMACDVLVVGAGPAGLAAALVAGRAGARVVICDEGSELGGRLLSERDRFIDDEPASKWLTEVISELKSMPEVRLMARTTVFGVYDQKTYGALERVNDHVAVPKKHQPRQRAWHIVARRMILASGAIERPMLFTGNDLPGVMLASAVRTYVNRFCVLPGERTVVVTSSDDGWRTAVDLKSAGADVAAVIDTRTHVNGVVQRDVKKFGLKVFLGAKPGKAHGRRAVRGLDVHLADGKTEHIGCDCIAVSNGWSPTIHLTTHLNGKPVWDEGSGGFLPSNLPVGMEVAGAAQGDFGLAQAIAGGSVQGATVAAECGFKPKPLADVMTDFEGITCTPYWEAPQKGSKAFVDLQNDVTVSDVYLAHHEGFRSPEHLKRYTTLGMATDQGKTSNVAGHALMAALRGEGIASTGTTIFRPPYIPVAIGALAGHHRGKDFRATRLTASHGWAKEQGATFVETGLWLRAQYFPKAGDADWLEAANREVLGVRKGVGVCDVSTLGKIDIQGADAAAFLDRVYVNTWSTLPVGKARYGVMLRDDGFVMDDGTTSRLDEHHFFMTTTTANAVRVLQHLEFCHQVLWPELDVAMVSVTEQWSQYSIAGPHARSVLQQVVDAEHDISNEAFPYLAARPVTVSGVNARLFRISFSGELAYELSVPASYGDATIRKIIAAGERFGIVPYGTEALGVMRIEKGHVAGNELSGQTTLFDIGLDKMMSRKKDCIGRIMSERPALRDSSRPRFIGFRPVHAKDRLRAGAHIITKGKAATAQHDEGYLSSVAYSPELGHWIGLGFLKSGPERTGEQMIYVDLLRDTSFPVEVCSPVFIDPNSERLHV